MPSELTCLRVFIASPSGLTDERRVFRDEIQDFNEADAIARGVLFQAVGWEDTLAGIGRPQAIINEDVRNADYFLLLLWTRWGAPTDTTLANFTSGVEEEYHVATECCANQANMRQIVMMFKAVAAAQLSDPGPQLRRVIEFKKEIEEAKSHLFHTFDETADFRRLLRKHLAAWLREEEKRREQGVEFPSTPNPANQPGLSRTLDQEAADEAGSSMTSAAWQLAREGRLTEAEVEFARRIVEGTTAHPLIDYGDFLSRVGRLNQATTLLKSAVEIAGDQKDVPSVAKAHVSLGTVLQARGDFLGAQDMYEEALQSYQALNDHEGMANAYGNLGVVFSKRGCLVSAEETTKTALDMDSRLGREIGMANAYTNLGIICQERGRLDEAEVMYRKSLIIHEKLNNKEGIATDQANIGQLSLTRGDYEQAERLLRDSLAINQQLGLQEAIANDLTNLGTVLQKQGNLDAAERTYREALGITELLGLRYASAGVYAGLGGVLQKRGDTPAAEVMCRRGLDIYRELGSWSEAATGYANLGMLLHSRGDLDSAEQMYRKAIEIRERYRLEGEGTDVYRNLARLQEARSDSVGGQECTSDG